MAPTHRPRSSRVTLAEVAKVAGVSVGAVSQVLNDNPTSRISDEVRARIVTAAADLGYRPNLVARTLRTSKSHTYGFVSDAVTITRFASGILRGALEAAHERGYFLLIAETAGDEAREKEAVQSLLDRGVDGIVFAAMKSRYSGTHDMRRRVPSVNVNLASTEEAISILPDEFAGGRIAVRVLTEAGHRDGIALVGHDFRSEVDTGIALTARRRLDGIAAEMAAHGIAFVDQEACDDWQPEQGYAAARRMLRGGNVTALLCLNDRMAFGAYQAIAEERLGVPDDVSVISFDDDEVAASLRPGLTTVAIPHERMGALAIEVLGSPGMLRSDILVPMPIHERLSVGAPASGRAAASHR
jgi:LacI family transcriptional regulator